MPKQGHRTTLDRVFLSITALFVLGGFIALGFLKIVSEENRALFVIASSLGMLGGIVALGFVSAFWRRLRVWTWKKAMSSWDRSSRAKVTPRSAIPDGLDETGLRQLAIQTYTRMGYRVPSKEGAYLRLINPDKRIELIACNAQPEPLALPHVYSLDLEMKRIKARRAFFWAPAGFTSETIEWVKHRPIVLADGQEIGRLVDCARSKGSRLLEY